MKKILTIISLILILLFTGCTKQTTSKDINNSTPNTTLKNTKSQKKEYDAEIVKVASITAYEQSKERDSSSTRSKNKVKNNRRESASNDELTYLSDEEGNTNSNVQYIIIYRSYQFIKFTIKLDNPEAYGIDAIRLYCSDPNGKIEIEGEYKNIATEADGTRVVNWASEDAYEKTFNISLSDEEYINTIEVRDIRLAGHSKFQSKEVEVDDLGKNTLKVYKLADEDLIWNYVKNDGDRYEWYFTCSEKISNLNVYTGDMITVQSYEDPNKLGVIEGYTKSYYLESNCVVIWEYDFTYEGVTLRWRESREIELLEVTLYDRFDNSYFVDSEYAYVSCKVTGTDISLKDMILMIDGISYNSLEKIITFDNKENYQVIGGPTVYPGQGSKVNLIFMICGKIVIEGLIYIC